jgi:hypothetical protein
MQTIIAVGQGRGYQQRRNGNMQREGLTEMSFRGEMDSIASRAILLSAKQGAMMDMPL